MAPPPPPAAAADAVVVADPDAADRGPPFEPLLKPWVKALAGGTFIGLLVGASLGAAIVAVKLNAKPAPPVSTAPIVVPSQFEPFRSGRRASSGLSSPAPAAPSTRKA